MISLDSTALIRMNRQPWWFGRLRVTQIKMCTHALVVYTSMESLNLNRLSLWGGTKLDWPRLIDDVFTKHEFERISLRSHIHLPRAQLQNMEMKGKIRKFGTDASARAQMCPDWQPYSNAEAVSIIASSRLFQWKVNRGYKWERQCRQVVLQYITEISLSTKYHLTQIRLQKGQYTSTLAYWRRLDWFSMGDACYLCAQGSRAERCYMLTVHVRKRCLARKGAICITPGYW